jgi:hypothetical protein
MSNEIGLKRWEADRAAWLRVPPTMTEERLAARRAKGMLFARTSGPSLVQMAEIYQKAIVQRKKPRQNMNLSCLMPCLKHGKASRRFMHAC